MNHSLEQVIEMYATRQQGPNYSRTPVNPDARLHTSTYRKLSPEGRRAWLGMPGTGQSRYSQRSEG